MIHDHKISLLQCNVLYLCPNPPHICSSTLYQQYRTVSWVQCSVRVDNLSSNLQFVLRIFAKGHIIKNWMADLDPIYERIFLCVNFLRNSAPDFAIIFTMKKIGIPHSILQKPYTEDILTRPKGIIFVHYSDTKKITIFLSSGFLPLSGGHK